MVREKLRATTATAVRGREYDIVVHQQAAMPEQRLGLRSPTSSTTTKSRRTTAGRQSI